MNNLIDNALSFWRRGLKEKIIKSKYIIIPILYLLIIMYIVPKPNMVVNEYKYSNLDTYRVISITKDEKVNYILDKYGLTKSEFQILCAIVLSEAESNSYEDAYAVINTIYNRTHSKAWVRSVNGHFGNNRGKSLYYQAISPKQFTVYSSGAYLRHLNDTKSIGYEAIIDFLYTEDVMHNYLSFRSHSIKVNTSESFSANGNNYFNILSNENRI